MVSLTGHCTVHPPHILHPWPVILEKQHTPWSALQVTVPYTLHTSCTPGLSYWKNSTHLDQPYRSLYRTPSTHPAPLACHTGKTTHTLVSLTGHCTVHPPHILHPWPVILEKQHTPRSALQVTVPYTLHTSCTPGLSYWKNNTHLGQPYRSLYRTPSTHPAPLACHTGKTTHTLVSLTGHCTVHPPHILHPWPVILEKQHTPWSALQVTVPYTLHTSCTPGLSYWKNNTHLGQPYRSLYRTPSTHPAPLACHTGKTTHTLVSLTGHCTVHPPHILHPWPVILEKQHTPWSALQVTVPYTLHTSCTPGLSYWKNNTHLGQPYRSLYRTPSTHPAPLACHTGKTTHTLVSLTGHCTVHPPHILHPWPVILEKQHTPWSALQVTVPYTLHTSCTPGLSYWKNSTHLDQPYRSLYRTPSTHPAPLACHTGKTAHT